mgnify:CR=1 FL=1
MRAWIGLGANLGDAADTFGQALGRLDALPDLAVLRCSSLYRSAPVDADGPDYRNAAAELATARAPQALLEVLLDVERALGRERPYRNAPRRIELDFLPGAPMLVATATLQLPHPRLHERAFALAPLAELDPSLDVPGHGSVATLLRACAGQRVEREAPLRFPASGAR